MRQANKESKPGNGTCWLTKKLPSIQSIRINQIKKASRISFRLVSKPIENSLVCHQLIKKAKSGKPHRQAYATNNGIGSQARRQTMPFNNRKGKKTISSAKDNRTGNQAKTASQACARPFGCFSGIALKTTKATYINLFGRELLIRILIGFFVLGNVFPRFPIRAELEWAHFFPRKKSGFSARKKN